MEENIDYKQRFEEECEERRRLLCENLKLKERFEQLGPLIDGFKWQRDEAEAALKEIKKIIDNYFSPTPFRRTKKDTELTDLFKKIKEENYKDF